MAPELENFLVYKSSAGSGKTFTLVKEYLQIILENPDAFRNVLAITFTNKAANEMKERIIRYLKALADPEGYPEPIVEEFLLPEIARLNNLSRQQISLRAALSLRLIMHHYSDFAVSTIDSFFHRVVKTFAYDLNIPLSFEVVVEEQDVLEEVVSLLLGRVGTDSELTQTLVRFTQSKAMDERSWDIEKDMVSFSDVLIRESDMAYIEKIACLEPGQLEQAGKIIWQYITSFEKKLGLTAEYLLNLLDSSGLNESALAGRSRGIVPWLQKLASRNMGKLKIPSAVIKAIEKADWSSSNASIEQKTIIRQLSDKIDQHVLAILNKLETGRAKYLSYKIIYNYIYPMAVLGEMERLLQSYRAENNILLISEFNRRIHRIVSEQPAPFIYERLGEKYHHYMIDEFQDTSILQWHNILPLMENSLAEGNFNLVVGDGKQAIYRFRSGDVRQFEMLPRIMKSDENPLLRSREGALMRNYKLKELRNNFRSAETLVDFNNRLFKCIQQWWMDELMPVYTDVEQEISVRESGYLHLEFINVDEGSSYNEQTQAKVLETIDDLLKKDFRPQDIAVLCRKNRHASQIAGMLLSNGKQVISADSLVLSFSPEVNFLVAWVYYLNNPANEVAMGRILYYLLEKGHLDAECIEHLFLEEELPDKWEDPDGHVSSLQTGFLEILNEKYPALNIDGWLHLDLFHLSCVLIRNFIDQAFPDPYLLFFQDQLIELVKKNQDSLCDAIEWWEDKGRLKSITTPEGLDAIRVMTIHKAKGLEFPVVIFPYADESIQPTKKNTWVNISDENLKGNLPHAYIKISRGTLEGSEFEEVYDEEYSQSAVDLVNVFYVAMTRARDQLYVFTSSPPGSLDPADSIPKMFKRFLMESSLYEESKNIYSFGEPLKKEVKEGERPGIAGSLFPLTDGFSDWKSRLLLRRSVPECWDVEEPGKTYAQGNIVHYILSEIKHTDDIPVTLNKALVEGIFEYEDYVGYQEMIKKITTKNTTAWLFDPSWTVYNEAEIISSDGRIFRPDRLMFRKREAVVVDYKTGRKLRHHHRQIGEYASLLKEMGWEVKKALLVYLGRDIDVVEVLHDN
jgi:ATP-dependent exoDNAse (exonuclease V) beta subunit